MSKRDDDSQADIDIGMTTAERRRRRRRGAGLRVPSDNVPRRTNPPIASDARPVPEDPSLAMSIAYSFTTETTDARDGRGAPVEPPSFVPVAPDAQPTTLDPVVAPPVEHADFESKTREMTAVDLEELGLQKAAAEIAAAEAFVEPDLAESVDEVEPDVEADVEPDESVEIEVVNHASGSLPRLDSSEELDVDIAVDEATAIAPLPRRDGALNQSTTQSTNERLRTVALSDEDLEEVREVVRGAPPAAARSVVEAAPELPHAGHENGAQSPLDWSAPTAAPRPHTPTPPPPIAGTPPRAARSAASEMWDEETPPPRAPIADARADGRSNQTMPLSPVDIEIERDIEVGRERSDESGSMPEIDIADLAERAESSGEFEVDVDVGPSTEPAAPPAAPTIPSAPPPPVSGPIGTPAIPAAAAPISGPTATVSSPSIAVPAASDATSGPTPHPKDGHSHPPPPPAAALHHKPSPPPAPPTPPTPPAPPPAKKDSAAAKPRAATNHDESRPRGKPWFVDLFDEDYLRTLPFLTPQATQAEADFVANAMGLVPGAQVLDVGCGYGRHAMELAARGFHIVGLDLSTSLLIRGEEEAQRRGLQINFVRGDMRELDFDAQFDAAYCLFSTFGYFDDETNKKTIAHIGRALRPGGRVLIEILNRDYVIADLPTRVWWEGDGCVVLEEVELNYFSSRIQVNRSVVFDDGRQLEQEVSIRAYSLHEVGKLMHAAGFRVLEVSGGYQTRGRFFGNQSRHIIVLAERKDPVGT